MKEGTLGQHHQTHEYKQWQCVAIVAVPGRKNILYKTLCRHVV